MCCQGTTGEFSGTILRCGMSGLSARGCGEITVSCQSDGLNLDSTEVTQFDAEGLLVHTQVTGCTCPLYIHPNRTRIESNCQNGYSEDYGLEVEAPASQIHFLAPLTKEHVSSRNGGGGDSGGKGVIDSVALVLRLDDTIHVPEESTTIAGAVARARESQGKIKYIVVEYGRYGMAGNYIDIDFSPLEIIGMGNDKTFVAGGFKITGEKIKIIGGQAGRKETHLVNKAVVIKSLCIAGAQGSGIFGENGIPVIVEDCTIVGSRAYGICCQLTWMKVIETVVENSGLSGIFSAYGGKVTVSGPRSRVWGNGQKERRFDFGVRNHGKNSSVHFVAPLVKEKVSTGNFAGGDFGMT